MSEAEIEEVRAFCRAILTAFPGTKITVKDRLMSNPKPERDGG